MFNLLFSSLLWASPLGESETSYAGATILEGNIDVAFDHITNIEYETDSRAYAFFEGNTLYVGNSDDYGNSVDGIVEFYWFQSSIDRGSDFYVAVIKARATPGHNCPGWQSLWFSSDCELWADDWQDWGEYPVLTVEAMTDVNREQGAFRWDWAVPFENYGIDAYGQVTFSNSYGIGGNAEGAVMAHGEYPITEDGSVQAAGNVQVKGYISPEYTVRTQYEVTLYEWDVFVNGRADLMAWDTYLNLGARADQSAYHEYFMSIQVAHGESFILDEINFSSHFDVGNINPFAHELGFSIQNMEISAPFWDPEEDEEEEWENTPEPSEEEEVIEEEPPEIIEDETEDIPEDGDMPSLSYNEEPIKTGCSSYSFDASSTLPFLVFFVASLVRRKEACEACGCTPCDCGYGN
jgi:hypothetical protein